MNPFLVPQRPVGDFRPLCPWRHDEHERYYVPVDNTAQAFEQFKEHFSTSGTHSDSGRVLLVSGHQGCGKTALLHRCANWLQASLHAENATRLHIINLGADDSTAGMDTESRVRQVFSLVLDQIELNPGLLEDDELTKVRTKEENPPSGYAFLSKFLLAKPAALAVILPEIELVGELKRYGSLVQPRITFFCESSYEEVEKYVRDTLGTGRPTAVIQLSVGLLGVDDGWNFVDSRIRALGTAFPTIPSITQDTMRRVMETRMSEGGRVTIRELQLACMKVFDTALAASSQTVEYQDFLEYYTRYYSRRAD